MGLTHDASQLQEDYKFNEDVVCIFSSS